MPLPSDHVAIMILAAGSSSRLGRPKQLLPYKGNVLINYAVNTALATQCSPIVVITGATHQQVAAVIANPQITLIENTQWATGMASSIHCGLTVLEQTPFLKGVLIILCDQPLITPGHLLALCQAFADNNYADTIATGYANGAGVPAIFPANMFADLYNLHGGDGARQLLNKSENRVKIIPFEYAQIDIDTQQDYERLLNLGG